MQFKVQYTLYAPEGYLTSETHAVYFGDADSAEVRYNELSRAKQDNGMKAFKVDLFIAGYKPVADPATFFEQFHME